MLRSCLRSVIQGKYTPTATLPRTVVVEKERFGPVDGGAKDREFAPFRLKAVETPTKVDGAAGFVELTDSCKSWAHCWLDGSGRIGGRLYCVRNTTKHYISVAYPTLGPLYGPNARPRPLGYPLELFAPGPDTRLSCKKKPPRLGTNVGFSANSLIYVCLPLF